MVCVSPNRVNVRLHSDLSVFYIGYPGLETWEIEIFHTTSDLSESCRVLDLAKALLVIGTLLSNALKSREHEEDSDSDGSGEGSGFLDALREGSSLDLRILLLFNFFGFLDASGEDSGDTCRNGDLPVEMVTFPLKVQGSDV
ncbi:hypothetical protein Tco_1400404 [Tanacetum coccineum]